MLALWRCTPKGTPKVLEGISPPPGQPPHSPMNNKFADSLNREKVAALPHIIKNCTDHTKIQWFLSDGIAATPEKRSKALAQAESDEITLRIWQQYTDMVVVRRNDIERISTAQDEKQRLTCKLTGTGHISAYWDLDAKTWI